MVGIKPQLPELPVNIKVCLNKFVITKKGDWTSEDVADIVAKYRRREIILENCLEQVARFYDDLRVGLSK